MNRLATYSLLFIVALFVFVKEVEALSSPCQYCTYCDFCDECSQCPCSAATNPNCNYCKYCKYCSACSMCSVCQEGGFLDKMSSYLTQIKERFGFELTEIKEEDVTKDLKSLDIEKERRSISKKKKKDEL